MDNIWAFYCHVCFWGNNKIEENGLSTDQITKIVMNEESESRPATSANGQLLMSGRKDQDTARMSRDYYSATADKILFPIIPHNIKI